MDLFLTAERGMDGFNLPFFLCLCLNLCALFCFINVYLREYFEVKKIQNKSKHPVESPNLPMDF
jgi:hypothetical protein